MGIFMSEYEGDQGLAELNYRYYEQRRVKNLLRIHQFRAVRSKLEPVCKTESLTRFIQHSKNKFEAPLTYAHQSLKRLTRGTDLEQPPSAKRYQSQSP
jgi:hypothetical protein